MIGPIPEVYEDIHVHPSVIGRRLRNRWCKSRGLLFPANHEKIHETIATRDVDASGGSSACEEATSVVKKIPLSGKHGQGKFALVDDEDYELVAGTKWHLSKRGYVQRRVTDSPWNSRLQSIHRLIMSVDGGDPSLQVDHANGDKVDNRRENLRLCSAQQNSANVRPKRASVTGYRGVKVAARDGGKPPRFVAACAGRNLGHFKLAHQAAKAYDREARRVHGEFAVLNFPEVTDYSDVKPIEVEKTSKYRGVCWVKTHKKWRAHIQKNKKIVFLGHFSGEYEAALAYDHAAREIHGKKAKPNFAKECSCS